MKRGYESERAWWVYNLAGARFGPFRNRSTAKALKDTLSLTGPIVREP